MKVESFVCALLAAASIASAAGKKPAAKPGTEKKTMTASIEEWKGQYGGSHEAGHRLITDLKGWMSLASQLGLSAGAPDFTKSVAVVAFAGERPTGGFSIVFDEPAAKGDDLFIRCRVKKPAATSFVTQALTQPWKVRVFPRPKGRVVVEFAPE